MKISNILKTISEVTKPVPLISVPMGLVNIFIKTLVIPCMRNPRNEYFKYVAKKSWAETLATPFPVLGGFVYVYKNLSSSKKNT